MTDHNFQSADAAGIALQFVTARLAGKALADYPGILPLTAAQAYECQDRAIQLWSEPIAGWKVGLVAPAARAEFGAERLVGPVFAGLLRQVGVADVSCPVFVGGFAAVEAEFVFRIVRDTPSDQLRWTAEQAAEYVASLHVGAEIASSPLATINDLGPTVIASDFGNNFGLLIGHEVVAWQACELQSLRCETMINGKQVGWGTAASIPGGPLTALAFALSCCAQRGYPLQAGQYVCTGATTGVHIVHPGDVASVRFHDIGNIGCSIVTAGRYSSGGRA